jgi:predicted aldo/keto reductase-like oxidoreductase
MRKAEELVMAAIKGGVNYFDTAYMYPGNEEALGSILEKNRVRDKVFIATKLPMLILKGFKDFDKCFDLSLERLKTDYIDYYLLHMLTDLTMWQKFKSWGMEQWIAEKKKAGKIRRIGFSYHGSRDEFLKIIDDYPWEFCQIQYNYADENYQAGITGLCKAAEKMPVMIMEPLMGGKLAGGLPKEGAAIFKKANPALSPSAWGLNWVWNRKEASVVLSGMNEMVQLEENLRLADSAGADMLCPDDREIYKQVLAVIKRAIKIHCTNCSYCMPCPQGVNIPGCFEAYNASFSMGFVEGMKRFVSSTTLVSERRSSPGLCIACGRCENHCPQHIPIIAGLKEVRRRLEPLWFRLFIFLFRSFLGKNN